MRRPVSTGGTLRSNYEVQAKRGNKTARQKLKGPPFPEPLRYLWIDYLQLSSGCIEGVTWQDARAWMACTGKQPEPHEIEALLLLHAVVRNAMTDTGPKPKAK